MRTRGVLRAVQTLTWISETFEFSVASPLLNCDRHPEWRPFFTGVRQPGTNIPRCLLTGRLIPARDVAATVQVATTKCSAQRAGLPVHSWCLLAGTRRQCGEDRWHSLIVPAPAMV